MSEWISVEDEMPEDDGVYLCHFNDDTIETFSYDKEDDSDGWKVSTFFVTHWQPLPSPPK